jgi:hypothetical protein
MTDALADGIADLISDRLLQVGPQAVLAGRIEALESSVLRSASWTISPVSAPDLAQRGSRPRAQRRSGGTSLANSASRA